MLIFATFLLVFRKFCGLKLVIYNIFGTENTAFLQIFIKNNTNKQPMLYFLSVLFLVKIYSIFIVKDISIVIRSSAHIDYIGVRCRNTNLVEREGKRPLETVDPKLGVMVGSWKEGIE